MGVRMFGGGQAPPLVNSRVSSLAGMAPLMSPNVRKTPMFGTLSTWRSGLCASTPGPVPLGSLTKPPSSGAFCAQLEVRLKAQATARAILNFMMFCITLYLSFPGERAWTLFLLFISLPARASRYRDVPNPAGFGACHSFPEPASFSHEKKSSGPSWTASLFLIRSEESQSFKISCFHPVLPASGEMVAANVDHS